MPPCTIAFPHRPPIIGGPGTFQTLLVKKLEQDGWGITYPDDKVKADVVFVVGGTAKLGWLASQKRKGATIVHRLDGLNWKPFLLDGPFKEKIVAQIRNWLCVIIRNHFADHVVYQSNFIKEWWHRAHGMAKVKESVIYNSTDLSVFHARTNHKNKKIERIVCVEGAVGDDAPTVNTVVKLAKFAATDHKNWAFYIYGDVGSILTEKTKDLDNVNLCGRLPRSEMAKVYNMSDVYLALEINPPCPNSVVEALASGLPVVGYDTGSLSELISPDGGVTVPYGGNPWHLDSPDVDGLYSAINEVDSQLYERSSYARRMAEERFDVKLMLQYYMEIIEQSLTSQQ